MASTESRTHAALDAATRRVGATVASVAGRVAETLGLLATTSVRIAERDQLNVAQFELRRHAELFQRRFLEALRESVASALAPRETQSRRPQRADWQTLSLVDDAEMEERMHADRLGQAISHACDAELRELAGYMGSLLQGGRSDIERHPLRAEVLGLLVYRAIEGVARDAEPRKLLAREFGRGLEKAMPACYAEIVRDLQALGLRPVALTARGVEGPGLGGNSGYATLSGPTSGHGEPDAGASADRFDAASTRGDGRRSTRGGDASSGGQTALGGLSGVRTTAATAAARGAQADAALMSLLRRLTAVGGVAGEAVGRSRFGPALGMSRAALLDASDDRGAASHPAALDTAGPGQVGGLMAVNVIRAHREELVEASSGQLDHMVIDVVGSLFDQILSDTRVPPQMARQIARLQLPVLRVALSDAGFFSSRRHPVRRFVNRIASLACAFDDFEAGPGLQFIGRVRELVQEIVDGDFDQIDLYTAKLADLERFIAEQTAQQAAQSGAVVALAKKETELRLQQRCRQHLAASLAAVPMPPWLRDFLEQVWSQALVLAAAQGDADTDRLHRYRRAGRDLVLSVQPKGSPAMRKKFLMQLPPLMKDLNEGMARVGWPPSAQQRFLGLLLPAQAESMKLAPLSELDHNLMAKQLEAIFLPAATDDAEPLPDAEVATDEPRFSAEEARAVGLVPESTVDWSVAPVDIDLGADPGGDEGVASTGSPGIDIVLDIGGDVDPDLGGRSTEPAEPTAGPDLMDHIKLGFAYQMHLQDAWQKVRLTHVSAGRGFFVFSHGRNHQQSLSMTSRMLARMCETGRLRAVESAYLMERATQRARRQLAALKPVARA